jgi:predicted acyl esterase
MPIVKRNSPQEIIRKIRRIIKPANIQIQEASPNMNIHRDVHIPTRDGGHLSANLYMPKIPAPFPIILALHPTRKDVLCKDGYIHIQFRLARQPGQFAFSDETSFEAPDPDFWVANGYAVINIDKRGFGLSPTDTPQMYFGQQEIEDIYDAIEWAGVQDWSNGNVGMLGVSYLAINQYRVAAMQPPHLKAICPWEGVSDLYRDWFYPGGVREDGFTPFLFSRLQIFGNGYDMRADQLAHETRDEYWKSFVPDFSQITVPMLNCISSASQMMHTRGSARAYAQVGSTHKWLYTHRGGEWTVFYSTEAQSLMLKFFDYFLKGVENGMLDHPRVRLEVRESGAVIHNVRYEDQYPPENVQWEPLYLNGRNHTLQQEVPHSEAVRGFNLKSEHVAYTYQFDRDTELIGPMSLLLYVALEGVNDANLFVGVQKFHDGKEVTFDGTYGFPFDLVTKSAQRVALRELSDDDHLPPKTEPSYAKLQLVQNDEVVKLVFDLEPSATFFRRGDELRLLIQGRYFISRLKIHQPFGYQENERGRCHVHTSPIYTSRLMIPVLRQSETTQ